MNRRQPLVLVLATALLSLGGTAFAQGGFPDKPVKLIVPFPPGGTSDITGRILAEALGKELGQPVVVENKGGAGGTIGARFVADAKPDGYTLLLGTSSTNGTNSAVYKNLPFDGVQSFTPITRIVTVPGVLSVTSSFPAKTYAEFYKLAKESPGKFSYASSGNGGATHMAMEYYKSLSGLRIVHVPYRGTGPALNDVVGGQVQMIFDTLASSYPHIKAGTLIPMAVAAPQRAGELPNVPTFVETGLKTFNEGFWNGVLAPAGLPPEVLKTLHGAVIRALRTQSVKDRYAATGALVVEDTPEAFTALITADIAKWKRVAAFGKITLD
ncbi:Bug family tripartite tricarboxylate transporter substrate binding protein [Variovorax sp. LT1R16]|uniref:Bug family tripartite tricarboxylate transporter substrate binding protein n=1 Tax=Variovorax sp. LT1R16 TaxID=3443728 RepID=UPI003F478447